MAQLMLSLTTYPHIAAAVSNAVEGAYCALPAHYQTPTGALLGNTVHLPHANPVSLAAVDAALGTLRNTNPHGWADFTEGDQDEAAALAAGNPALAAATWLLNAYFGNA